QSGCGRRRDRTPDAQHLASSPCLHATDMDHASSVTPHVLTPPHHGGRPRASLETDRDSPGSLRESSAHSPDPDAAPPPLERCASGAHMEQTPRKVRLTCENVCSPDWTRTSNPSVNSRMLCH